MNILILTVDTNYHSPIILRSLFNKFNNDNFYVFISDKSKKGSKGKIIKKYPFLYILYKLHERLIFKWRAFKESIKINDIYKRDYLYLSTILNYFNIQYKKVLDINSKDTLKIVNDFSPDIIISLYFDQILKKDILNLSKVKPINLHPSLLPSYAGTAPTFWVLAKGEDYTGITIHEMEEEIDEGKIIYQEEIEILSKDTQYNIYRKCSIAFIKPLISYLNSIKNKGRKFKKVVVNKDIIPSYCSSKVNLKDLKVFLNQGKKFI